MASARSYASGSEAMWYVDLVQGSTVKVPAARTCACCLEPAEGGSVFEVPGHDAGPTHRFPGCAACLRHARVATFMTSVVIALGLVTVAGGLVALYGLEGLTFPFRSAIRAALTLAAFVGAVLVHGLVLTLLMRPLKRASCPELVAPVERQGWRFKFTNATYGRQFGRENGATETKA